MEHSTALCLIATRWTSSPLSARFINCLLTLLRVSINRCCHYLRSHPGSIAQFRSFLVHSADLAKLTPISDFWTESPELTCPFVFEPGQAPAAHQNAWARRIPATTFHTRTQHECAI